MNHLSPGYTQINNALLEALMSAALSKRQLRVLLAIVRQTCGFHRDEAELSGSRLADLTGLHRQHCVSTLTELESLSVVFRSPGPRGQRIRLNLELSEWADTKRVPEQRTTSSDSARHQTGDTIDTEIVTDRHQCSDKPDTETGPIKEKKERTKERKLKKAGAKPADSIIVQSRTRQAMFDIWWEAYPKKRSKGQAWKAWQSIDPDEQLLARMLASLQQAVKTNDWQKQGGQFVPYPASWLRAEGWNDVYEVEHCHGLGGAVTSTLNNLQDLFRENDGAETLSGNDGLSCGGLRRGDHPGQGGCLLAPAVSFTQ